MRPVTSNEIAVLKRERCTSKVELSLIISMTVIARAKRSSKYSYISMVHREEGIGRPWTSRTRVSLRDYQAKKDILSYGLPRNLT